MFISTETKKNPNQFVLGCIVLLIVLALASCFTGCQYQTNSIAVNPSIQLPIDVTPGSATNKEGKQQGSGAVVINVVLNGDQAKPIDVSAANPAVSGNKLGDSAVNALGAAVGGTTGAVATGGSPVGAVVGAATGTVLAQPVKSLMTPNE